MKEEFRRRLIDLQEAISRALEKDNPSIVMPYLFRCITFLWTDEKAINKNKKERN